MFNGVVKKTTLVESVVNLIIQDIEKGTLKIGQVLPPENEMASSLNVSRATIRESISYLLGLGVLVRNDSSTVVQGTPKQVIFNNLSLLIGVGEETNTLYETRLFYEVSFSYFAALKATETDIKELIHINNMIIDNVEDGNKYLEYDFKFHFKLAEIMGNEFLSKSYKGIMEKFIDLEIKDEMLNQENVIKNTPVSHSNLIEAIIEHDPNKAVEVTMKNLVSAKEDLVGRNISKFIENLDISN